MSNGLKRQKTFAAITRESLAETFEQADSLSPPASVPSSRKAMRFSSATEELPTLIRMKLHEAVVRAKLEGTQFRVRRHDPAPQGGLPLAATIIADLIETTVTTFYADEDRENEGKVLAPVMFLHPGSASKPWRVVLMPFPPAAFRADGTLDAEKFDIDLHDTITAFANDLRKVADKKTHIRDLAGGSTEIVAADGLRLFDMLERLYTKKGFLTLDSTVGASTLHPKTADRKTGKPYFATRDEFKAYAAARVEAEHDKAAPLPRDYPEQFMDSLLPKTFLSLRHAAHNSAAARTVTIAQFSFPLLRHTVASELNIAPDPVHLPLQAYH